MGQGLESVFLVANLFVLPFWLLMIVLPGWRVTRRVMASPFVVAVLPALYAAVLLPRLGDALPPLWPFPDLKAVSELLGSPTGAALGWIHFLAFDLFVGRFIFLDSHQHPLAAYVVIPILLLTLLFGPAGLLAYLLSRAWVRVRKRCKEGRPLPPAGN